MVSGNTLCAPAERARPEDMEHHKQILRRNPVILKILDALPGRVVIMNQERQILFANQSMLESTSYNDWESLIGRRLGEAINCVHHADGPGGCGTSEYCRTCGAVQAFMESHLKGSSTRECRITMAGNGFEDSLELLVWATQIELEGHTFTIFAGKDVSHEKRRRILEKIFFHDVLNTAGGLRGLAELIKLEASGDLFDLADTIYDASDKLINEIQAQKELMAAENDELQVQLIRLSSRVFLEDIVARYSRHHTVQGKSIVVAPDAQNVEFTSDPNLLGRVIGNLLLNAVEASKTGNNVTAGCGVDGEWLEFWVHNNSVIDRQVQLQLFQRSFTTKGAGRGLGTYSVKLLTERYLKGKVSFYSEPDEGTKFMVKYPMALSVD